MAQELLGKLPKVMAACTFDLHSMGNCSRSNPAFLKIKCASREVPLRPRESDRSCFVLLDFCEAHELFALRIPYAQPETLPGIPQPERGTAELRIVAYQPRQIRTSDRRVCVVRRVDVDVVDEPFQPLR